MFINQNRISDNKVISTSSLSPNSVTNMVKIERFREDLKMRIERLRD